MLEGGGIVKTYRQQNARADLHKTQSDLLRLTQQIHSGGVPLAARTSPAR
jgi:hypothetical protein